MSFNARTVRDGTITCSVLALALACATGTLEEDYTGDGIAGRGTSGAPSGTAGSAGSSGGAGGGQAGSGPGTGAGTGGQAVTGGSGGTTGGALGGGSGGSGGAGGTGGSAGTGGSGGSIATGGAQGQGGSSAAGGTLGSGGSPASGGSAGMPAGSGGGSGKGGTGGSVATGGKGGSSSTAGTGGSAGSSTQACAEWPMANGSQSVSSTIAVSGTYDGQFKRFAGSGPLGSGGQQENQDPLFEVANGGTLKNVIIGNPASDGVHCQGTCTLDNVWWEDVGEDAATFRGSGSPQMTVRCGGAKNATDKIFQHNGGGTLTVEDFQVDGFSKLYRSCGNCTGQVARHVVLRGVTARSGSTLVGINTNYGDTADFERITIYGNITICERYTGNSNGGEPVKTGSGSDGQYCRYDASDITQR